MVCQERHTLYAFQPEYTTTRMRKVLNILLRERSQRGRRSIGGSDRLTT